MSGWVKPLGLVVVAAGLYGLAFPPVGWWPLGWIALVPLIVACAQLTPPRALAAGATFGLAAAYATSSWLPAMLADFFEVSWIRGLGMTLAVYAALAASYFALFAGGVSIAARRGRATPVTLGLLFAGAELARAHLLVPNPWALLGYSQQPFTSVVQLADAFGPFGLGALMAAVAACIASAFSTGLRPPGHRAHAWAVAGVGVLALAYGEVRLATAYGEGDAIRVALVQGAVEREKRFKPAFRQENLDRHLELTDRVLADAPSLVLWPEFAVDFPVAPAIGPARHLIQTAQAYPMDLVVGAPTRATAGGRGRFHNSALLLRGGEPVDRYDKVVLMPFSESNPLREFVPIGTDLYRPGSEIRPLESGPLRIGMLLCSEAMLPGYVRATSRAGANLLANPSNDEWFNDAGAAAAQLAAVSFRAVENRRFVVRPASNGYTAAIDPHGRLVAQVERGEPHSLVAEVRPSAATTPYQRWGDAPLSAAAIGAWIWAVLWPARTRSKEDIPS